MINFIIYLQFLAFSFGQIGRISLINQQINFYLYEPIALFLVGLFFLRYKLEPLRMSFKKLRSFYFFILIFLFSFLINIPQYRLHENGVAFLYLFRLMFYFFYFIYLRFYLKKEKADNILSNNLWIFIIITVFTSLIQYFLYPDLRNLFYLGWDPHLYRMFGLFFDTAIAGAVYGMTFLFLLNNYDKNHQNYNVLVLLITYFIFIVLTFSRSLYIVLSICIFCILLKKKALKNFIFYILFFIFLIFIVPKPFGEGVNLKRVFSIESRIKSYSQAVNLWKKNPLLGIGYNHIRYEKIKNNIKEVDLETSHAGASFHSSFLIILVTGGILGLLSFIWLIYQLARSATCSQILVIFLGLLSLTDNIILHPLILFYLLVIFLINDGDRF